MNKKILAAGVVPGYPEDIGRWLWALQDVRERTLRKVQDLDQRTLDWEGPRGDENSIGSLLYHIAFVEMDWLFMDLHEGQIPAAVKAWFPREDREQGRLTRVPGIPATEHVGLLNRTRDILVSDLSTMNPADWRTLHRPSGEQYEVSPDWVVYHLVEHESGHLGQISALRARAGRFFAG